MALDTYANLQTAIANFLARDDLTTEIVDFIKLTEADFKGALSNLLAGKAFTKDVDGTKVVIKAG